MHISLRLPFNVFTMSTMPLDRMIPLSIRVAFSRSPSCIAIVWALSNPDSVVLNTANPLGNVSSTSYIPNATWGSTKRLELASSRFEVPANCSSDEMILKHMYMYRVIPKIKTCITESAVIWGSPVWRNDFILRFSLFYGNLVNYHAKSHDMMDQAPVPLSIFRSNSKFDENSKHSSVKYTRPITTIFCTRHDSVTVVTCAKYRCDRSCIFDTRAFWIFIEFRIRSKYA